jgi:transcriptional regulator with XRE-family HTH domain
MDFLRTLVEARKAQNLSQHELARRLGRPQSFVSKYERGERRLDVVEFLHVARELGLSATDIMAEMERKLPASAKR